MLLLLLLLLLSLLLLLLLKHIIIDRSREKVVRQVGNKDVKKIIITLNVLKTINEEAKVASPALFCCF